MGNLVGNNQVQLKELETMLSYDDRQIKEGDEIMIKEFNHGFYTVRKVTAKAFQINESWFPKSQVTVVSLQGEQKWVSMPEWLAIQNLG